MRTVRMKALQASQRATKEHELIEKHKALVSDSTPSVKNKINKTDVLFENKLAFTVSEVAFLLGISQRTIERKIKSDELKVIRIGRAIRIPKQILEAWLTKKE